MEERTLRELDNYLIVFRNKVVKNLENKDFIGKIGCEISFKCGGIVSMHVVPPKEFVKI